MQQLNAPDSPVTPATPRCNIELDDSFPFAFDYGGS